MDDPILEKRLKNMFESRAGELPDESVREARIRRNVYEKIEREENYMKKGFYEKSGSSSCSDLCIWKHDGVRDWKDRGNHIPHRYKR